MPPKPRARKATLQAAKAASPSKAGRDATSMPPPAEPRLPPLILEREIDALSTCMKNAMVKTGQIFQFHNDVRTLGIHKYAPQPPQSLTASLGHEIEMYDQLCDVIESHIRQAIAALQRRVQIEEQRIKDAQTAAIATRTRSKSKSMSPSSNRIPLPSITGPLSPSTMPESPKEISSLASSSRPTINPGDFSGTPLIRRASTISLSSLQRPSIPHKLDLSPAALGLTTEEASLFNSGLASPVTLAPRSARPSATSEYPADFMAAFAGADAASSVVDLELAMPDIPSSTTAMNTDVPMGLDSSLGSSADKPIELDLDVMDLDMSKYFGEPVESGTNDTSVDGFFTSAPAPMSEAAKVSREGHTIGIDLLEVFSSSADDIFASLSGPSPSNEQSAEQSLSSSNLAGGLSSSITGSAQSPGSIMASLTADSHIDPGHLTSAGDASFDLGSYDLSQIGNEFFASGNDMDMEAFLGINGRPDLNPDAEAVPKPAPS